MRRSGLEDEAPSADPIGRQIEWLIRARGFCAVLVAASIAISIWSSWKAISHLAWLF